MFTVDAATEAITHFIGLFELTEERARLRLDYDELSAARIDFATGDLVQLDHAVPNPYQLRDLIAEIRHTAPAFPVPKVAMAADYSYGSSGAPLPLPAPQGPLPFTNVAAVAPNLTEAGPIPIPVAPPILTLPTPGSVAVIVHQHLWLSDDDLMNVEGMDYLPPDLLNLQLEGMVAAAATLGLPFHLAPPASEAGFLETGHALRDLAQTPADGTAQGAGADAFGTYLDGESGAARPDFDALLPDAIRERAERENNGDDGPAHQIVHGANTLVNEVVLTASWISAPVMAVGGSSVSVDLISQVNMWRDIDTVQDVSGRWTDYGGPTAGLNFAALTHRPQPVPAADDDSAPRFWAVSTIEGSLINVNWITQHNFVSDNDVTSVTLSGTGTTLLVGANGAANSVSLQELGYRFDLIIVDGDLIDLAAIFQTNVLLDSDIVRLSDGGGGIGTGDNLLINDASILRVGQASHVAAEGDYADLPGSGPDGITGALLRDPGFAGLDGLRVLHIKGDLVSAQIIQQINVLGDADQVDLLAEQAMEEAGDVSVVTGSNMLVNSAQIAEYGVDSVVHAKGEIYSDALIHQASLIDTAPPDTTGGLASEAVVFLTDPLHPATGEADIAHLAPPPVDMVPADPMQTVLS